MRKALALITSLALLQQASAGIFSNFFGQVDWYEAPLGRDDSCDQPPPSGGGGSSGGGGGGGAGAGAGGSGGGGADDGIAGGGEEEFGGDSDPQTEKFFSLVGVDVCDGASVGDEKCICARNRFNIFRRSHRLKCGVCKMQFTPENARGAMVSLVKAEELVALENNSSAPDISFHAMLLAMGFFYLNYHTL